MSKPPLDPNTVGPTAKLEVRVPRAIREEIRQSLRNGEKESQFVRDAIDRELKRRRKRT